MIDVKVGSDLIETHVWHQDRHAQAAGRNKNDESEEKQARLRTRRSIDRPHERFRSRVVTEHFERVRTHHHRYHVACKDVA